MKRPINPDLAAATLVGFFLLVALLPMTVNIEVKPRFAGAEDTATAGIVEYTLSTITGKVPPIAFIGKGGSIDGVINPTLNAQTGDTVRITLVNGEHILHDMRIDEFGVNSGEIVDAGETKVVEFVVTQPGDFAYYCNIPGHKDVGMKGIIHVEGEAIAPAENSTMNLVSMPAVPTAAPVDPNAVSIVRNPADLPPPVGNRDPMTVRVDLTTQEVSGVLADGTTYTYFTFDGKVPGPMIRIREGDVVELHLTNATGSQYAHSIDLHAVTGPGGGAVYTQTQSAQETMFTFKALNPGLYVYHCATPSVAHHIASGMYGLILVEPAGGLTPVDHEFYVMEGEIYTEQPFGTPGHLTFSHEKMLNEDPEYFVLNGAAMALTTDENALRASVGDTVRIFFGVGGPNATSSFHVIGEIFDRVYDQASLTAAPLTDVQTTLVPPGGATIVEFQVEVPGRYILVDHALSRLERGLAGYLYVEGDPQPDIFDGEALTPGSGH